MRGTIPLKVGRFRFDADATLDIETDDDGTTLIFRDELSGHMWAALIDEFGKVIDPIIRRGRQVPSFAGIPPAKGEALPILKPGDPLPAPVRRTKMPATKVWLIIQYGPNRSPKKMVRVLGGFTSGGRIIILYRSCVGNTIVFEDQLLLDGGHFTTRECVPAALRLPDDRWDEVLSLKDQGRFDFNGRWRKLSLSELNVLVHAKRFRLSYDEKPPDQK